MLGFSAPGLPPPKANKSSRPSITLAQTSLLRGNGLSLLISSPYLPTIAGTHFKPSLMDREGLNEACTAISTGRGQGFTNQMGQTTLERLNLIPGPKLFSDQNPKCQQRSRAEVFSWLRRSGKFMRSKRGFGAVFYWTNCTHVA